MDINALIISLLNEFPTEEEKIRQIKRIKTDIDNGIETISNVEKLQQICNDLYNIKHSDYLIDLQVIINEYRNKLDITDPREIIHVDNGKGYVQ